MMGSLLGGFSVSSCVLLIRVDTTELWLYARHFTDFSFRLRNLFYGQKNEVREVGWFAFICLGFDHAF